VCNDCAPAVFLESDEWCVGFAQVCDGDLRKKRWFAWAEGLDLGLLEESGERD
jgi:hypothetical protein